MATDDIMQTIGRIVNECRERKGLPAHVVEAGDELFDGHLGIDSLDVAAIIVELELETGRDPFSNGIVNFKTVGALAELFGK